MKLEIFSGLVLSVLLTSCFATAAIAQTSASPIPYGGSHPFERYQPIPPDPPNPNAPTEKRLPNGYTPQQMEWLKANPHIRIYPDGTIEHLHMSREELMERARNNPDVPQAPPGWNSRLPGEPGWQSTPGVPPGEVPGPHPIQPASP